MNSQLGIFKNALVISLLLLYSGCSSEELDFDQTLNFESKPIYKVFISDFIPKLDVKIPQIPIGSNTITYNKPIDLFNKSLFKNSLTEIKLNFLITNKINSNFTIEIQLKEGTTVFDTFTVNVPAYNGVDFEQNSLKLYPEAQIPSLIKIDSVTIKVTCDNITASSNQSITMSTRLTAYIKP